MSSEPATPLSEPATPSSAKKVVRQKFAAITDGMLLRAVNAFQPWRAPAGTANVILKVFEDIAVSGTVEQYQEGHKLLLDILTHTKDWEEKVTAENKITDTKQQAIESSGALMGLAICESIEDSDEGDEDTGGEGTDGTDITGATAQALALIEELLAVLQ
ncbi:unnamed protein product [Phytophthora fragariaefolia]|uniref:Unnamed protein product n=1 Tax=Phytophthora fragariaefolia TaxID=1490495 RepID=A0A9W6XEI3_9STRA|nr:unnamed protein product [Phytophthora fragariaefolia]